jgi:hypothetical protein
MNLPQNEADALIEGTWLDVCLWHKADMTTVFGDVCFWW